MRLSVERDALLTAVGKVRGAVSAKGTIPILGFVLLNAGGAALSLSATNLDMQAKTSAEARVEAGGAVAAPAGQLYDVLRALPPGGEIGLELTPAGRLALACGMSRVELPTLPASDFPVFPTEQAAAEGEIPAGVLARLFDRTRFAASTDAARYYLNGVHLHREATRGSAPMLRAVATNGHQLAYCEAELPDGLEDMPPVILPTPYVAELRRNLDAGGPVDLAVGPSLVWARVGGLELAGKVIDGTYPDYRRVIPGGEATALTASKLLLLGAIKRARIVIDDSKTYPMTVRFAEGELELKAFSYDRGQVDERVPVQGSGEPFERMFNAAYLFEMIDLMGVQALLSFYDRGDRLTISDAADASSMMLVIGHRQA